MTSLITMTSIVDVLIEIPYNSFVKYEYDDKLNKIRCDRILNTSMLYPGNYGYIPNTLAGDGDPIDILMICDYPIYPGVIVECKIIGVLMMSDEKGEDEKLLVIPSNNVDPSYNHITNYTDLPKCTLSKIKHFFEHYKDNETTKWCKVNDFENKEFATTLYEKAKDRYIKAN